MVVASCKEGIVDGGEDRPSAVTTRIGGCPVETSRRCSAPPVGDRPRDASGSPQAVVGQPLFQAPLCGLTTGLKMSDGGGQRHTTGKRTDDSHVQLVPSLRIISALGCGTQPVDAAGGELPSHDPADGPPPEPGTVLRQLLLAGHVVCRHGLPCRCWWVAHDGSPSGGRPLPRQSGAQAACGGTSHHGGRRGTATDHRGRHAKRLPPSTNMLS